mgnify:CR=1 FL=1
MLTIKPKIIIDKDNTKTKQQKQRTEKQKHKYVNNEHKINNAKDIVKTNIQNIKDIFNAYPVLNKDYINKQIDKIEGLYATNYDNAKATFNEVMSYLSYFDSNTKVVESYRKNIKRIFNKFS